MGAGTFILAAGYAKSATIAVTCTCIGVASSGLMHSGYNVNMLDIAPRYACVIMGITNTVGTITGFLSPMMVGFITVNKVSLISLGTCFSKVPKTFRARKAIPNTPTRLFCKAGLFICCKGNK